MLKMNFEPKIDFKREQQLTLYNKHRKSIVRPIIKAQEKLDRLGKKCTHRSGSEVTTPDSMKNTEGSMTTSSELVPPSPMKLASLDTQTSDKLNPAGLHPTDHAPYSGTFKFLGPATAIGEYQSEDEADGQETRLTHMENNMKKRQECCSRNSSTSATRHLPISKHSPVSKHLPASKQNSSSYQDNNINDVCFGCDGGCSDATCSRNAHPRGYNTLGNLETNCFQSGIEKRNESPEKTNAPKKFRNTK
ncbi:mitogen-activated protein kinase kinase kinase 12, partial [Biomphalaria glabrata]